MKENELTERQKKFCELYLKYGTSERAAIESGYSKAYARASSHRILANVGVKSYIEGRLSEMENKRIADANEVLEYLTSVVRNEVTEEQVIFDKEGSQIAEIKAGVKDRNKAAELLGKRYALFTEKKEISGKVGVEIVDDID